MKQVHTFDSTGDAYDASQIDLDKGSIMVVESEGVVGLAWTWPVAVTAEAGELRMCCQRLGIKVPTKLEDVPEHLRHKFEMVSPDFYV